VSGGALYAISENKSDGQVEESPTMEKNVEKAY